jgi:hypothetical protein
VAGYRLTLLRAGETAAKHSLVTRAEGTVVQTQRAPSAATEERGADAKADHERFVIGRVHCVDPCAASPAGWFPDASDYVGDWTHPTVVGHTIIANRLRDTIAPVMGGDGLSASCEAGRRRKACGGGSSRSDEGVRSTNHWPPFQGEPPRRQGCG